jgi:hypothetical protein
VGSAFPKWGPRLGYNSLVPRPLILRICQPQGALSCTSGDGFTMSALNLSFPCPPPQPSTQKFCSFFEIWTPDLVPQAAHVTSTRWATTQRADASAFSKAPTKLLNAQHMHMSLLLLLLLLHNMPFLNCQNIVKKNSTCSGGRVCSLYSLQLSAMINLSLILGQQGFYSSTFRNSFHG